MLNLVELVHERVSYNMAYTCVKLGGMHVYMGVRMCVWRYQYMRLLKNRRPLS